MICHAPDDVEHIQSGGEGDVGIEMHAADVVTAEGVGQNFWQRIAAGVEEFQGDAGEIAGGFDGTELTE